MMFLKKFSVILDLLLLVPGVCSGPWGRTYTSPPPCVLRGSSVDIGCSYDYPDDQAVTETWWYKNENKDEEFLLRGSEPRDRFQYIGDNRHDCTLRINNIEDSDLGSYYFKFETTGDAYGTSYNSYTLPRSLSGLTAQLQTGDTVSEGGEVILYCVISCEPVPRPPFVWFKDGQQIPGPKFNAKIQDAGGYQCAVEGQETWKSAAVRLDVQYGPQDVVLSVSPQGDVVKGSSVTLSCSSSGSNPRIQSYIILKNDNTVVAQKKMFTISNIQPSASGTYSCQAKNIIATVTSPRVTLNVHYAPQSVVLSVRPQGDVVKGSSVTLSCSSSGSNPPIQSYIILKNDNTVVAQRVISNIQPSDSGTYSCQAKNNIATVTSPRVTLNVHYPPENTSVSVNPPGEVVEGSSVTLTCSSDANPPVHTYTWYRDGGSTAAISTGPQLVKDSVSRADSGQYTCRGTNKHGPQTSSPHSIDVLYPPENTSVSVNPPGEVVEGSSVTLTCSCDANPPVDDYTWYKMTPGSSSPLVQVGSGPVFFLASLQSSHAGLYVCHTRNSLGGGNSSTEVLLRCFTTE